MQKRDYFFLFAILASQGCGGRTGLDEGLSSNSGGLSAIGGTSSVGGSPSTGGSTNTGATTCPSTAPQAGDQCLPAGLFCVYPTSVCPLGYQCSTGGEFEQVYVPCFSGMGGTTSTGGSLATGGGLGSSGSSSTSIGGTTSTGGDQATGCSGSFEMILGGKDICVAKMVPITGPKGGPNVDYKIDATEVTTGQYDAWLATSPSLPPSTDVNCRYVTSYSEQGTGYLGPDADHHPVVYVDWCDAYEYCLGVDKRLCGALGGGPVDYSAGYNNATQSQWYRACSSGGTITYPYGNTYQATFCDGWDYWNDNSSTMQTVAVGSLGSCATSVNGYAGVYDLSGNVFEWEDSCDGVGPSATCRLRGGAFNMVSSFLACSYGVGAGPRVDVNGEIGFRCCTL